MVQIETEKIVGSASLVTWSQAQTVGYGEGRQLMVVLELSRESESTLLDLATVGTEILAEAERRGGGLGAQITIDELVAEIVRGVDSGLKVGIVLAYVDGEKLTISGRGQMGAYLAREGKLAQLGSGEVGVRGTVKEGDVLLLSTSKFVEDIGLPKIKEILLGEESPGERLAPLVHTREETSGMAGVVGVVKGDKRVTKWPEIRLRSEGPHKFNLWIGGALLVTLIVMIGVGMVRRVRLVDQREYGELANSVNQKVEEARATGEINPERARQLLMVSREEVGAYLGKERKEVYKRKGGELVSLIEMTDEQTFKKNNIQLSTVVELSVLSSGLSSQRMKSDGRGNLIFLDNNQLQIVEMNLGDRSKTVIAVEEEDKLTGVGVMQDKVYGVNGRGVYEASWKKKELKRVIEADEFWKDPTLIEIFAGNVYVFDKEQSEIWKYPTLGETFGGRRRWLAAGITPDLSKVVDMKVVGDIWLLTSSGKLLRYSRGAPVSVDLSGFPYQGEEKTFLDPVAMYVGENTVYILERGAGRLVAMSQDGKYEAQYVNQELARASDVVVVDDKAYVLIDNVVKEFGL